MYNIEHQLVTKEKIIEYFQFLEDNIYEPLVNLNYQNLVFAYANPNLASPSPVTKSFGEKFANFCKMCVELEQDIRKYFKYYEIITPFRQVSKDADLLVNHLPNNFDCFLSGCTSGTNQIFMMPKGYYVTCHGAFGDIVDGYKKSMLKEETYNKKSIGFESYLMNTKSPLLLNEKQYERFSQQQEITFDEKNPSRGCFLSSVITMLALSGQIDKKYLIDSERINAMKYVGLLSVYCIYNNQVLNGSTCLGTADDIKLFLNGALDYIIWR